ncbi:MAG: hypothetical protein HQK49_18200 [Oligoflexia bacterium]|nr:hypothetical protein [Oligoflexia bacterium]
MKKCFGILTNILTISTLAFLTFGCNNPLTQYYKYVQNYKYLPFTLPVENYAPGSIVFGDVKDPTVMPPSDHEGSCFPLLEKAIKEGLLSVGATALPSITTSFEIKAYGNFDLSVQGFDVKAGAEFHIGKSVTMKVEDPKIVSFDYFALKSHINKMSADCQQELQKKQMVIQGLWASGARFIFKNSAGESLSAEFAAKEILKIGAGLGEKVSYEKEVELVFKQPLFIGMKLGKFDKNGKLVAIASTIKKNQWVFVSVDKYLEDKSNFVYDTKDGNSIVDESFIQFLEQMNKEADSSDGQENVDVAFDVNEGLDASAITDVRDATDAELINDTNMDDIGKDKGDNEDMVID